MAMNDKERVENAIIPTALLNMIMLLLEDKPEQIKEYEKARQTLTATIGQYTNIAPEKKKKALQRRLQRLSEKMYNYYVKNKFDTRKGFIVLTTWAYALADQDALTFIDEKYVQLLQELDEQLSKGYEHLPNFDKIRDSALKHVPKVHAIAQSQGYF